MHPIQELIKKKMVFGAWCVFEEEVVDKERCRRVREKKAFTLVNMEDPGRKRENKAVVTFDAPKKLLVHGKDGSRQIKTGEKWEITLGFGEGLFVEIL